LAILLAIESSCDDTSAAIIKDGKILSNVTFTQKVHEEYGGVVPEVASRQHHLSILPVVIAGLDKAGVKKEELDGIAVTKGPGLMGSLLVGVSFAKAMAMSLDIPLIEVHHMHAHILAHFAEENPPQYPFLCMTISGGHTQIVLVKNYDDMEILGSTIDDAAGEAFDKTGKMLGLLYPAGMEIDQRAKRGTARFTFSEPSMPNFDFSFSGFKTSVLYFLRDMQKENPNFISENLDDLCASIQKSIVTILMNKLKKAVKHTSIKSVAIAGGVAANSGIRNALLEMKDTEDWDIHVPALQYCTDNAGMVAIAGYYKYIDKKFSTLDMSPDPKMPFLSF
jgi:N6-L-threonylcarbamoyladenine synthase